MNHQQGSHQPARWERGASRLLAHTRVLDLMAVEFRHPVRQTQREFVCFNAPDWVNVVPLTAEGKVLLVRQFRYGSNDFSLEVPGGVMEAGEDPVAAALRELAEETGYGGGRAKLLGSLHPNPAIQSNRCHAVLVEGLVRVQELDWDADEEIEIVQASMPEVLEWMQKGQITHSLTVCALMLHHAELIRRLV